MGHGISCARSSDELEFFRALQSGDLDAVREALSLDRDLVHRCTPYGRVSPLHIAAANGHLELLSMLLNHSVNPDILNRNKQTPLMLSAMHGKIECVNKLLEAGANILMFDSLNGRTCLHLAAYYGHTDCLKAILLAAQSSPVAQSWGFARFVNLKDDNGATSLHLASRQGRANSVHILLDNGAIVSSPTVTYGFPGSTPLHLAARGGWVDCVRELLAWGADRLQRDSAGRIPYAIALKRSYCVCAALLNPSSAEPLVWPSPLKFISELNADAKELLEAALMEANLEREKKIIRGAKFSCPSPSFSEDGSEDNISEMIQ
ncbi:E3 ubiquitin-protein ligase XB3-like protein [Carex littledalei]|uniref:E3 ubiquitin-protein ligase XB3-like protein n=1 Tax=Carex littledalei TaxID=544730 RepID=A0A833R1D6_9POAL|nr:E3 ubiquitin-protein ligase XB3-like protein [Carex littledalei]